MTIKVVNQYSVTRARSWVRGSLQAHGEQCVLLSLYHPGDNAPICPNCSDDIYDSGSSFCPICFGVGSLGGVKEARRVWALFSDRKFGEEYHKRGVWSADAREIQTEAFPELLEHDVVVRVRTWDLAGQIPQELEGFYGIGEVIRDSLRTGARFGQFRDDIVGQRAQITKLQSKSVGIADFPILGQSFPDVSAAALNVASVNYSTLVGDGVNTVFTVTHDLGTENVTVSVYRATDRDAQVTTNVNVIDSNHVSVGFGFVPSAGEFLVTVLGGAPGVPAIPPVVPPDTKVIYIQQTSEFTALLGDGSTYVFTVKHGIGTKSVVVSTYWEATGELFDADVNLVDTNTITVGFDPDLPAPAQGAVRCVVKG